MSKKTENESTLREIGSLLPMAISSLNNIPDPFRASFESKLCDLYKIELERLPKKYSLRVAMSSAAVMVYLEVASGYLVPWNLFQDEPHQSNLLAACEAGGMRGAMDYSWKHGGVMSVYFSPENLDLENPIMRERYLRSVAESIKSSRVGFVVVERGSTSIDGLLRLAEKIGISGSRVVMGNRDTLLTANWFCKINPFEAKMGLGPEFEYKKILTLVPQEKSELPSDSVVARVSHVLNTNKMAFR